eukprot:8928476-Alexandrium_andersonii.AAC.1
MRPPEQTPAPKECVKTRSSPSSGMSSPRKTRGISSPGPGGGGAAVAAGGTTGGPAGAAGAAAAEGAEAGAAAAGA